jgi:hypothetical protein
MKFIISLVFVIISLGVSAQNHLSGLHLQLNNTVIDFDRRNVQEAILFSEDQTHAGIILRMNPATAQRLQTLMQKMIGQTGLWIWDGKIIATYQITGMNDDSLTVFHLPKKDAEQFVKSIQ